MTHAELIALAKSYTEPGCYTGNVVTLARAFPKADAERERLQEHRDSIRERNREALELLDKAHAERDAARAEVEAFKAARYAYASEFDGDEGSIHQNIRALKAELSALRAEKLKVGSGR